ncbi:MAG: glutamate ligase domain-containing protein, partial [Opitutales bacterium]
NGRLLYVDCYNANPASMADALDAFNALTPPEAPRLFVLGGMEELGAEAEMFHRALGRSLRLRPQDRLFAIGEHAAALVAGAREAGAGPTQVHAVEDLGPVRESLAGFAGAVFLKGSRRYQLETLIETAAPAHAHA